MNNQETEFCVLGMTCTGCTQRVAKVLERVDGVRSADVSLDDKLAKVNYDADTANFEDMKQAVEKAGYTVEQTEVERTDKDILYQ